MPSTATVTAKTGPGQQLTSVVFSDVVSFSFLCDVNVCEMRLRNGSLKSFAGFSTITVTLSGNTYTLTLS